MRIGYVGDFTGQATRKVRIIDETILGKYVLKGMPIEMTSIHGNPYLADQLTGLFLRDKVEVRDIKEEGLND